MTNGDGPSFFARYIDDGRSPPEPTTRSVPLAAGRLLDWLQRRPQPTIRARTIYQYGPRPRDKESTLKLTAILERRGWLVPMKTNRHDAKWWRIAIGD